MKFENELDILLKSRLKVLEMVKDMSLEEINIIPEGFNNSIAWNVAHLVVTQQLLCYKLSNNPMLVPDSWIAAYRKGTKPSHDHPMDISTWQQCKTYFIELVDQLEKDLVTDRFNDYQSYTTSMGVTLTSIEKAVAFNNIHEGLHFGYIQAMKRVL